MTAIASPRTGRVRLRRVALRQRLSAVPLPLALLLVVAAVHAGAWCFATAPLNGPDEPSHAAYVQYLAETGHAPERYGGKQPLSTQINGALARTRLGPIEGHQEGRPDFAGTGAANEALRKYRTDDGDGPNPAAANPPLYYAYGAIAYRLSPNTSLLGRLTTVRLATALLFVLTVALTWLIAAELFAATWARVLMTGLVALQPKLAFLAGLVNPDMLVVTLATGALLAALLLVKRGPSTGRLLALGLTTSGAVLTQSRALYLVGVAVLVVAYVLWRWPAPWRERARWAGLGAGTAIVATMVAYLWVRSHSGGVGYGGQAPGAAGFNLRQFASYLWQFYLPQQSFMEAKVGPDYGYRQVFIESYFGQFGSLEVEYRKTILDAVQLLAAFGLLALWTAVAVRWRAIRAQWPVAALLVVTFLGLMALLHLVSYSSLRTGADPIITGRYLLLGVALYGAAIAFVATSLPRRLGPPVAGALLGVATLMALGGLGLTVARFYG